MKRTIKYLVFTVIILIIICEILLRVFFQEQLKTRFWPDIYEPDSLLVYNYKKNTTGKIISPGVNHEITINNQGFLGPDFNPQKPDSIFRIVIVDNSDGTGLHMNSDLTYCKQLSNTLNAFGYKVEVINCAHNGAHKDIQNLRLIRKVIASYKPNLVLCESPSGNYEKRDYVYEGYKGYTLQYDPYNPKSKQLCIENVDKVEKAKCFTTLYDISYIFRALCRQYISIHSNWWADLMIKTNNQREIFLYTYITKESIAFCPNYYYTYDKAIEELKHTQDELKKINCQLYLFTYSEFSPVIKNIYDSNNIKYMQLKFYEFYKYPINSKLEGHLNQLGHAFMAERLFSQIVYHRCIPDTNLVKN